MWSAHCPCHNLMRLKLYPFVATSPTGEVVDLYCQTKEDARFTGAELLNEKPEDIKVHRPEEWC